VVTAVKKQKNILYDVTMEMCMMHPSDAVQRVCLVLYCDSVMCV